MKFTIVAKEAKLLALQRGRRIHQYLDDWLAEPDSAKPVSSTDTGRSLIGTRLADQQGKIRTGPQAGLRLCRSPVRLESGQGQTHPRALADLSNKDSSTTGRSGLFSRAANIPHRLTHSNREAGPSRSTPYEANTVAPEKQLEGTRVTRKGDPYPQIPASPSKMVVGGKQYASRETITPTKTWSADLYRCIKRRVGHSLNEHTAWGT